MAEGKREAVGLASVLEEEGWCPEKRVRALEAEIERLRELARAHGASEAAVRAGTSGPTVGVVRPPSDDKQSETSEAASTVELLWVDTSAAGSTTADSGPTGSDSSSASKVVVVTAVGREVGDEIALTVVRYLAAQGVAQPVAVVANTAPAKARARLAQGTLATLGLPRVPVGVGSEAGEDPAESTRAWAACDEAYVPGVHGAGVKGTPSGRRLLHATFATAAANSLTLVLLSCLKDAALFLRDNAELFVAKVQCVVLAAGDVRDHGAAALNGGAFFEPDRDSPHHRMDAASATFLFARLQELGVPVTLVTESAARAAPLPRALLDDLAETGSPVGRRVRDFERARLRGLWRDACAKDAADRAREGAAFAWACSHRRAFLDRYGRPAPGADSPSDHSLRPRSASPVAPPGEDADGWRCVASLPCPAALAIVAAVPELRKKFFLSPPPPETTTTSLERRDRVGMPTTSVFRVLDGDAIGDGAALSKWLRASAVAGASCNSSAAKPDLVIVTDPGQDQDDEMALIMLRALVEEGFVECAGVVCNLGPSEPRARLARGTLDVLGLHEVPVAAGTDGGSTQHADPLTADDGGVSASYVPERLPEPVLDGQALLLDLYRAAPTQGLHLLLISSLTDVALFLEANEALFVAKTRAVTVMGGVKKPPEKKTSHPPSGSSSSTSDDAPLPLLPDTAANNAFDPKAADFLYAKLQDLGVPMVVLSRHAAYKCSVPRQIYDDLAWTGHAVGRRLQRTQRASIESLWRRAASTDPDQRRGLPARCDKAWFLETFCRGRGHDRTDADQIWDLVASFNMYDPLALVAAIPELRQRFFAPYCHRFNVDHLVIGLSDDDPGIADDMVQPLRDFMYRLFFKGATLDFSSYAKFDAHTAPARLLDLNRERAAGLAFDTHDGPDLS